MRITPFPCCCGVAILSEFNFYGSVAQGWNKITAKDKAEFDEQLKKKIEINKGLAFLFIVLNESQMDFEKTLLDRDFVKAGEGHNNAHESTLCAYILSLGAA